MNAPAVATAEGEHIAAARAILAADGGLSADDTQRFRDALWRYQEAGDRVGLGTLKAILQEIESRSSQRMQAAIADQMSASMKEVAARRAQRSQRWAALPPGTRAAFIVASENGGPYTPLGRSWLRFAALAASETTAQQPPDTFEPQQ